MSGPEEGTIPVRAGEELDARAVLLFLRDRIPGLPEGELEVRQFASGASNLTYLLRVGSWAGVLRRPPFGPLPPKAHDMGREARILRALHAAFPLAPRCLASCEDPSVLGGPFHVMEYREGVVVDAELPPAFGSGDETPHLMAHVVLDALVRLHDVDREAVGLGDLGHPEGFLERQLHGWIGRWKRAATEGVPDAEPLLRRLADTLPQSPPATVIHNDYHLRNLLFAPEGPPRLRAVLDWEMTTVGDPLFDVAVFLSYWLEPDDPPGMAAVLAPLPAAPGFPRREAMLQAYAAKSGRDVSAMDWYLPFAFFKLAVILQQIYARWDRGQTADPRFAGFDEAVRGVVERARELAGIGGI